MKIRISLLGVFLFVGAATLAAQDYLAELDDQLPRKMHVPMSERPHLSVGQAEGDLVGRDHRVLQAAVDYMGALGGGTVDIGPGEYSMRDSLHLRSGVTVRGVPGKTILVKADGVDSPLGLDGDFGEEQVTVKHPEGFGVGMGVAIWDDNAGGFHTTVARVTGARGNTFSLSRPLNADCLVSHGAKAATVFPVVSGYDLVDARIEGLIIEGNRGHNLPLNGCRGGGIFLYRAFGTIIRDCVVRNYNGDGISFQQSNDVVVEDCVSEGNASLGLHPGSGSQRPVIRHCVARNNGDDGLFLCWRVRHGTFENNRLENNGRFGISIGHKDTDNVLQGNQVIGNGLDGIFFRNETLGMAANRNRIENNLIENNGRIAPSAGIRVRGETGDLIFRGNLIRDTRDPGSRSQVTGIRIEDRAGAIEMQDNRIVAEVPVDDQR